MKVIDFLLNIAAVLLGLYLAAHLADLWVIFIFGGLVVSAIRFAVVFIPWWFK